MKIALIVCFEFLTKQHLEKLDDVFPVEYNGFGWMLIKKGVIESLEYPWFRPLWQKVDDNINTFTSEDVGFCQKALEKGYKIYANKNIVIGFGITEKTIKSLKKADGLVVGSAICKEITNSINKRQNAVTNVTNIVRKLRNKIK